MEYNGTHGRWLAALEISQQRLDALLSRARQPQGQVGFAIRPPSPATRRAVTRIQGAPEHKPRRTPTTLSRRKRTMTYVITEPCIGTKDRSCVDVCPVDCIHDDGDDDRMLYINPEECIDCGACEPACPVTAIFVDYDIPEQWKGYSEVNSLWFTDKAAARARLEEILAANAS
ncbi:MAG: 4Fe-4S dicluster domain-containing protein [Candidatus Dormibacteria bacterium]